ncbi:hypothetical protein OAJ57_02160 [Alphaproteobacteria bacterium]|nr:hypothetical protein [Alphaproteobacteria bacterium]
MVNKAPTSDGWILKLLASDPSQVEALMNEAAYDEFTKS